MGNAVFYAACGTGFTFLMTALGAAVVFLFKKDVDKKVERAFMGFAGGVMLAACVWSLLIPAIEDAKESVWPAWLPVACGFAAGGLFLFGMDRLIAGWFDRMGDERRFFGMTKNTTLLLAAVALHNIPQGIATGLSFLMALEESGRQVFAAAVVLAFGIGIQNLPEGSAVAIPIRRDCVDKKRAFFISAGAGILEPICGIGVTLLGKNAGNLMPWMLSFAAGAMIYVISEELIPEAAGSGNDRAGVLGVMIGFLIMMVLNVALG
ncbi:MAG: ZIP family metal transporter [Lachnospiraceae bacterium]|nr:ZIP family metal transporter [Lachnospiraceae bacterium]